MRFFQRRRDGSMDTEQQGSEDAIAPHNLSRTMDSYYKNKSDFDQGDRVPSFRKDSLVSSSSGQAQQRFTNKKTNNTNSMHGGSKTKAVIESDDCPTSNNRQSIGRLVSKLNCSSSKKNDEQELTHQSSWQRATNTPASQQRTGSSTTVSSLGTTRPVLITVKDGDAKQPYDTTTSADQSYSVTPETKNSFLVGELPPRPSSFMCTARKRLHIDKESNKNRNADGGSKWDNYGYNRNKNNNSPQDLEAIRIAQGLARRERWKRGLEMELIKNSVTTAKRLNKSNNNNNEGDSTDDHSWAESWTQGSNTTGTSTTGESSSGDDWTDGSTADDSRMFYRNHDHGTREQQQHRRNSSHHSTGRCMSNEQIIRSVAEDVGVFAGLLFSDGVACLGTAAAITKETVADCNRKDHY